MISKQFHQVLLEVSVQLWLHVKLVLKTMKSLSNRCKVSISAHPFFSVYWKILTKYIKTGTIHCKEAMNSVSATLKFWMKFSCGLAYKTMVQLYWIFCWGRCQYFFINSLNILADGWKHAADDLLFLISGHCRAAQSAADKHTCRYNWEKRKIKHHLYS